MDTEKTINAMPNHGGKPAGTSWSKVIIGGTVAVALGGVAANAAEVEVLPTEPAGGETVPEAIVVPADEHESTAGGGIVPPESHDIDHHSGGGGQSFADAFAAARATYGAGGVFEWRGGLYGTYYEDEWNAMSRDQQNQFCYRAINHDFVDEAVNAPTAPPVDVAANVHVEPVEPHETEPVVTVSTGDETFNPEDLFVANQVGQMVATLDPYADDVNAIKQAGFSNVEVIAGGHVNRDDGVEINVKAAIVDDHFAVIADNGPERVAVVDVDDTGTVTNGDVIVNFSTGTAQTIEAAYGEGTFDLLNENWMPCEDPCGGCDVNPLDDPSLGDTAEIAPIDDGLIDI